MLQDQSNGVILHLRRNRSKCVCNVFFSTIFQYDEKDAYENFKQFYEDTLPEFRKAGTVVQFKVFFVNSLKNNNDAYKNARINAKFNCSSL